MKKDTSKSTILIISMGFLALYLGFEWRWAVYVSLSVGLIGVVSSYLSQKIEWLWMKLGEILGYIVPNILLSLVFFVILVPLSLLSKLFRKDPLMLSAGHDSYFIDVNRKASGQDMEKPW